MLNKGQKIIVKKDFSLQGKRLQAGDTWECFMDMKEGANALVAKLGKKGQMLSLNNFKNFVGINIENLKFLMEHDMVEVNG